MQPVEHRQAITVASYGLAIDQARDSLKRERGARDQWEAAGPVVPVAGEQPHAKTHFAFHVDIWDDTGVNIVEHVAGVDEATYRAAVARWPAARITLRQGIRVVHDTG
jgi:hypothetical protein